MADNRFEKRYRLLKTDDFSSVFAFRSRQKRSWVYIHQAKNKLGYPRLGCVVAKKVAKRANRRNYMKRVFREWFRQNKHCLSDIDIIIRVHHAFHKDDHDAVCHVLDDFFLTTKKAR